MKKNGFTLIELLIVTVVIVTLMGIVFRLAGLGGDSRAMSKTLSRLQRIENAISGYYAAFGSYPPVPLQGRSRDIKVKVNEETGVQYPSSETEDVTLSAKIKLPSEKGVTENEKRIWRQIEAACRAQPIAVLYPFFMNKGLDSKMVSDDEDLVTGLKDDMAGAKFNPLTESTAGSLNLHQSNWHSVNLFQFGLLSFLLPRYLFMVQGTPSMYENRHGQWAANNQLPCRMDTGLPYGSWEAMQDDLYRSGNDGKGYARIEKLPSQAVCARWMPNFRDERNEGIISGGLTFYGVDTHDPDRYYLGSGLYTGLPGSGLMRQASRDYNNKGSLYLLNGMTIVDGWNHEFYYHSEIPYQSYRLWSAGKNGVTFPPWIDRDGFNSTELEAIAKWTKDDVSHLAN